MIRYVARALDGQEKAEGMGFSEAEAIDNCEKAVAAYLKTAPGTNLCLERAPDCDLPMVRGLRWF